MHLVRKEKWSSSPPNLGWLDDPFKQREDLEGKIEGVVVSYMFSDEGRVAISPSERPLHTQGSEWTLQGSSC